MSQPNRHEPTNEPLACTLDADDLAERGAGWAAVDRHALGRSHDDGVLRTSYPNRPELRARLAALIDAERACCPFLELDLVEDGDVVELVLRYPPGAEGLLADVLPDRAGQTSTPPESTP